MGWQSSRFGGPGEFARTWELRKNALCEKMVSNARMPLKHCYLRVSRPYSRNTMLVLFTALIKLESAISADLSFKNTAILPPVKRSPFHVCRAEFGIRFDVTSKLGGSRTIKVKTNAELRKAIMLIGHGTPG